MNITTKFLVFADVRYHLFIDAFYPDDNYLIEQMAQTKTSVLSLKERLPRTILTNKNIKKIMFLFGVVNSSKQFISTLISLIKELKEKFPECSIYVAGVDIDDTAFDKTSAKIFNLQETFKSAKELSNFIEYKFALTQIRINYARCHHLLLEYLKKRCRGDCTFTVMNESDFSISNNSSTLYYKRDSKQKCYLVNDKNNDKFILKLFNSHLLGLYNPLCLFKVVEILKNIQHLIKCEVRIVKNEVFITESKEPLIIFNKIFEKIVNNFNKISVSKKFKIQLGSSQKLILNRSLKVSLKVMDFLLEKDAASELLIDLAIEYFKCFSITPVCCRMQSIAFDAIVYDFEKYSYFHLQENCTTYLNICKLLFPYVTTVDEKYIKQKFLEIIPVSLIGRLHGPKLKSFEDSLKALHVEHNVTVIPLSNGNFEIASYFNISAEMLVKIVHPDRIPKAKNYLQTFEDELVLVKHEDLESDSLDDIGFQNISVKYSLKEPFLHYVKNLPLCSQNPVCHSNSPKNLVIFSHENFHVIAYKKKDGFIFCKELEIICDLFAQAFKPITSFFSYPVCVNFCDQLDGSFRHNNVIPEYISPEINDLKCGFWSYSEKFIFIKEIARKDVKVFVSDLQKFEMSDGICLTFVKDKIDTIENMNMLIAELNPDYYKATADFFYYNEAELLQFFKVFTDIKEQQSDCKNIFDELFFVITKFGLIRFNNCVEIHPVTFLKINDRKTLLGIILEWSKLMKDIYPCTTSAFVSVVTKTSIDMLNDSEEQLAKIAENLNQMLTHRCDFYLSNFCCIPTNLFYSYNRQTVLEALISLRKKNLKISVSPHFADIFFINNCCFRIDALGYSNDYSEVFDALEKLEKINEDFEETILIKDPLIFSLLDYENIEKTLFRPPHLEVIDKEMVKQCLKIFEKHAPTKAVTNVVLVANRNFQINKGIQIYAGDLYDLTEQNRVLFFKAAENLGRFYKRLGFCLPDNLICLKEEHRGNPLLKQVSSNKKFENFLVIDGNKDIYLELAKVINNSLECISDEGLLSYEWLELIPRDLLMEKKSAEKLLQNLRNLKDKGIEFWSSNAGTISTDRVELPFNVWMNIQNVEEFVRFLNLAKYHTTRNKDGIFGYEVFSSGLFSFEREKESHVNNSEYIKTYQTFAKHQLDYFLNKNELSVVLNSGANLMLDNTIWMFLSELNIFPLFDFLQMVRYFKNSVKQHEGDNMMSLKTLCKNNKNKIISLAKAMNQNLKEVPDSQICHEKLKIIPKSLWEQVKESPKKVADIFQLLVKNDIRWLIKLNGNIELGYCLTVTAKDLLNLNNNEQKFEQLASLTKLLQKGLPPLICKEEVEYQNGKNERVIKTKITSYGKSIEVRNSFLGKKVRCRIESNESIFLNDNIWVRAEDAINGRYQVEHVSEQVKILFPDNKFQYGHTSIPILTSILNTPEFQLFEYCYNFCQLVATKNVAVEYLSDSNLFRFNNQLSIHPRSFFHLQDMESVIELLKKFKTLKTKKISYLQAKHTMTGDNIQKQTKTLDQEEKELCKELWKIKRDERLEFAVLEEKCFAKIGYIIKKNINVLKSVGNIGALKIDQSEPFWGVKQIKIQNEFIFQNGTSVEFADIKKDSGDVELKFVEKVIVEAILLASTLETPYICLNFSDFLSVAEIAKYYDSFKKYLSDNIFEGLSSVQELSEIANYSDPQERKIKEINLWLKRVSVEQNKDRMVHIFDNELQGLHHWFKHPQFFKNLEEYYSEMNKFFGSTDYDYEVDYQTGQFITRHHKDKTYEGFYGIGFKDSSKGNRVLSFQSLNISLSFNEFIDSTDAKLLIVTDIRFSNFIYSKPVFLNSDIVVQHFPGKNSSFRSIENFFNSKVKPKNTKKILLFFPNLIMQEKTEQPENQKKNKKNDKKKNNTKPFDYFPSFIKAINKAFCSCDIILCYSNEVAEDNVETLRETILNEKINNLWLREFDTTVFSNSNKNASNLKIFVESSFGIQNVL